MMTFHRDDPSCSDTFRMPSITSAAAGKWSSQWSGVLVNLQYIIELLLFYENGVNRSCTAVVYIAVCSLWKHG